MTPNTFSVGQRVRFKKEIRFADILIPEGVFGTVDKGQDTNLTMIRVLLDSIYHSTMGPTNSIVADRYEEIEPAPASLEEVKAPVVPALSNAHAICGLWGHRYDAHQLFRCFGRKGFRFWSSLEDVNNIEATITPADLK